MHPPNTFLCYISLLIVTKNVDGELDRACSLSICTHHLADTRRGGPYAQWYSRYIRMKQRVHERFLSVISPGYKINQNLKSVDEYAKMDANDESLKRWKESLGISEGAAAAAEGPQVCTMNHI